MLTQKQAIQLLRIFDFLQGQRAGRELWNNKQREAQDKDIEYFSSSCQQLIEYVQNCTIGEDVGIEKVKYGEWAYSATEKKVVCSRCRVARPFKKVKGREYFLSWHSKRCPECGAIMKPKEDV